MNSSRDLRERLAQLLAAQPGLTADHMFGGTVYRVDGKICCLVIDDRLLVWVDHGRHEEVLARPDAGPLYVDDRLMPGYVLVTPEGYTEDGHLAAWVDFGLSSVKSQPVTTSVERAGLWRRWFAYSIDTIILGLVGSFVGAMYGY